MPSHLNLDPGEKILLVSRRYFPTLLWEVVLAFFLLIVPFFLMFPLFFWGKWGIGFFIYCIAVGFLVLIKIYIVWNFNTLTITSKRVIKTKQRGFFDRRVSEMLISRVNDVSHHIKGFGGTLLRYGTLHIVAGNGDTVLDFAHMKNPGRALRILNQLLQDLPHDPSGKA